jgi:very-short-patch-repair endonuclease
MDGMRPFLDQDRAIADLAAGQYGVVTVAQLAEIGLGQRSIARRCAAGRLHRLHRGVYAVGHAAPRREARWLAAVLACGAGALLSHRSAASHWRIRDGEGPWPVVTVPTRGGRGQPRITIHRSLLHSSDAAVHDGIPVTSPARTLVDLAFDLDREELLRALREAQFLRLFDLDATLEVLDRRPCRALRALVDDLALTRSHLEDRLLRICDRYCISRPRMQFPVLGRPMDFVWPQERVVVETDGWEGHGTRYAFQADRATSNALQLRGYTILRFTHADLKRRPTRVARQIRDALSRA